MPSKQAAVNGLALKSALVVGATGLIGKHLVERLISDSRYGQVFVLVRRSLNIQSDKLQEYFFRDIDDLKSLRLDHELDHFFCALGTTQKQAGKEGLSYVDKDLVSATSQFAVNSGASLVSIVSALGASASSPFFYNRIKGQMESEVKQLGMRSLHLWQPSILVGQRDQGRFMEELGAKLLSVLPVGNYSPRTGSDVADAMIYAAQVAQDGHFCYKVADIDIFNREKHNL